MSWELILAAVIGAAAPTLAWLRGRAQDKASAKVKVTENRTHDARSVIEGLGDLADDLRTELVRIREQHTTDTKANRAECDRKIDGLKDRLVELEAEVDRLNKKIVKLL